MADAEPAKLSVANVSSKHPLDEMTEPFNDTEVLDNLIYQKVCEVLFPAINELMGLGLKLPELLSYIWSRRQRLYHDYHKTYIEGEYGEK